MPNQKTEPYLERLHARALGLAAVPPLLPVETDDEDGDDDSPSRPGAFIPPPPAPSASDAASDETYDELSALGADIVLQAMRTGKMRLKNGSTQDLRPAEILRAGMWALSIRKPKRKQAFVTPKEAFIPETK